MASRDHPKPQLQKPPPSSSAATANEGSSSHHRKSRWSSNTAENTTNSNKRNSTANQKLADDKRPSRPNPSPKSGQIPTQSHPRHPNPTDQPPVPIHPTQFPYPDPAAALGPPPQPSYGFHMLERRTIVLSDGSVRSYFALPLDYQDFGPQLPTRPLEPAANRFLGPEFGRFPPLSPEGFRDNREHWNHMKRKYPSEEEKDRRDERDELLRHRQQFIHYAKPNSHTIVGGTSSPFRRDMGEDTRAAKYLRMGGGAYESGGTVPKHLEVDQEALKKAFFRFVKVIYENPAQRKSYLEDGKKGPLQCLVCGRTSKDFQDMHGLIMHTYYHDSAESRVDHYGLHKALCVLMGWNFSKPPDNSKAYQILPAEAAAANQDDLIVWPPHIVVHNTSTGKGKDGRIEGYGNKVMDSRMRELGFTSGKSRSLYGREGHMGITVFRFSGDEAGLKDALKLADYFEKNNRGRKSWARLQPVAIISNNDEKNPHLVDVDERTGEKRRVLYGYLGTANDLEKFDYETKKKSTIGSLREHLMSK